MHDDIFVMLKVFKKKYILVSIVNDILDCRKKRFVNKNNLSFYEKTQKSLWSQCLMKYVWMIKFSLVAKRSIIR